MGVTVYALKSGLFANTDVLYEGKVQHEVGPLKTGFILACISMNVIAGTNYIFLFLHITYYLILGNVFMGKLDNAKGHVLSILIYLLVLYMFYKSEKERRILYLKYKNIEYHRKIEDTLFITNSNRNII